MCRCATRFTIVLVAFSLVLSACGGSDGGGGGDLAVDLTEESVIDDGVHDSGVGDESGDSSGPGEPVGPIDGLIFTTPSVGSGLFVVDEATGASVELDIDGAEFVDRNEQPVIVGDVGWALGATGRPDQFFSNDIELVRVDLASGTAAAVAELGFDRENDDATDSTFFELIAATADRVVVESGAFGEDGTWTVYDASGAELTSYPRPVYEQTFGDGGSCSGEVNNVLGLPDGSFVATAAGRPGTFDPMTGVAELFVGCETPFPSLADFVTADRYGEFMLVRDGETPDDDALGFFIDRDLDRIRAWTFGDGDLWWTIADSSSSGDFRGIAGAAVRFDPASGGVEAVHPLGEHVGDFVDCPVGGDSCLVHALFGELHFVDGRLVVVDQSDDAPIVIVDPAADTTTAIEIERGDDIDYTRTQLLPGAPDALWVEVTRFTITSETDEGTSASGESSIERYDPADGALLQSIPEVELGF